MKKRWISWWIGNLFWIIVFGIWAAIIWLREVDGAGVIQTPEIKSISLIVILIAFIIPVEKIIIRFSFSINNKKERNLHQNRFLPFTFGLILHFSCSTTPLFYDACSSFFFINALFFIAFVKYPPLNERISYEDINAFGAISLIISNSSFSLERFATISKR